MLFPLGLILALLIKLDSTGPVFYRQVRVGQYNTDFRLFKFRSMRTDADKKGLLTLGDNDNRVTRIGYYLRKWKIDELPQLINVFLGQMSFVGPRPEVRKYVDLYTPEQLHVLDVRPGITDAASIKYRNETELLKAASDPEQYYISTIMPDKLAINIAYVAHHSVLEDCKLILQTIQVVLAK